MREQQRLAIPSSAESEVAILGGLLLNPESIGRLPSLDAEAFHNPFHGRVFAAIQRLYAKGEPVEVVSVHVEMQARGEEVSIHEVHDLTAYAPGPASMRMYANTVQDCYRLRKLMDAGNEIARLAMTAGVNSAEQIDKAQMLLGKLATARVRRDPKFITESLADYLGLLQDLSEGKNPAIQTGIGGLDQILNGGLRRGEMMVIGARPKHGKTALSLTMARNIARNYGVLFLSQEMNIMQLMHRHTAASGSVDLGRILAAKAEDTDMWAGVTDAARALGALNLHHDEQGSLTLLDIRRKVLKVKRSHGLDVVFIDFLQLMAGNGGDNRNQELDVIVNGLKAMALDLDLVVVLLSQMNRKADEHYTRPTMTHLRDSGAIEAAADQIALLFTDWAHPLSKRLPAFKGYSELEIVAHRNGPQGIVPLHLIGERQQIGDWMDPIPVHSAITSTKTAPRTPHNL